MNLILDQISVSHRRACVCVISRGRWRLRCTGEITAPCVLWSTWSWKSSWTTKDTKFSLNWSHRDCCWLRFGTHTSTNKVKGPMCRISYRLAIKLNYLMTRAWLQTFFLLSANSICENPLWHYDSFSDATLDLRSFSYELGCQRKITKPLADARSGLLWKCGGAIWPLTHK